MLCNLDVDKLVINSYDRNVNKCTNSILVNCMNLAITSKSL